MEFRILGSVEVVDGGRVRDLGGLRERTLLARLLLAAGQVVSADRLAEDLWAGQPPAHYMATPRVYISRLRRALGDRSAAVITQPPGYRITLGQSELDADRFAQLVAAAREDLAAGRPEVAAAGLREALGLWRGPALSDVADFAFAQADAARLAEARMAAVEDGWRPTWPAAATPAWSASSTRWSPAIYSGSGCAASGCWPCTGAGARPTRCRPTRTCAEGWTTSSASTRPPRCSGCSTRSCARSPASTGVRPGTGPPRNRPREGGARGKQGAREAGRTRRSRGPSRTRKARRTSGMGAWPRTPFPGGRRERRPGSSPAGRPPARHTPGCPSRPRRSSGASPSSPRSTGCSGCPGCSRSPGRAARARPAWPSGPERKGPAGIPTASGWRSSRRSPAPTWLPPSASALGIREEPGRPLADTIAAHLRDSEALLIIDNCEHVLDAAAELVSGLLRRCPALRVLATSQTRLNVAGEATWPVPPLTVPPPAEEDPLAIAEAESVRLYCDRAGLARPGFSLDAGNAGAVREICRRLDGIPLALELAAARLSALTVRQLAARLDDRFRLLSGGSRTGMPRHRTLQAAIEWSHDLLGDAEQVAFRRLAVFAGGATLEAAEAVLPDENLPADTVFEVVSALVDRSLLTTEERNGSMR